MSVVRRQRWIQAGPREPPWVARTRTARARLRGARRMSNGSQALKPTVGHRKKYVSKSLIQWKSVTFGCLEHPMFALVVSCTQAVQEQGPLHNNCVFEQRIHRRRGFNVALSFRNTPKPHKRCVRTPARNPCVYQSAVRGSDKKQSEGAKHTNRVVSTWFSKWSHTLSRLLQDHGTHTWTAGRVGNSHAQVLTERLLRRTRV